MLLKNPDTEETIEATEEEIAEAMLVEDEVKIGMKEIHDTIVGVIEKVAPEAAPMIVFCLELQSNFLAQSTAVELGEELTKEMKVVAADLFKEALENGGKTC